MQLISSETALAIIGMEAQWGSVDGLAAYGRLIHQGQVLPAVDAQQASSAEVLRRVLGRAGLENSTLRVAILADVADLYHLANGATVIYPLHGAWNPLAEALAQARDLIASGFDAVVYLAQAEAGQFGEPEHYPGFGFDKNIHDCVYASGGVCAVVWMDAARAAREGRHVYGEIHGAAALPGKQNGTLPGRSPSPPALEEWKACIRAATLAAGSAPEAIQCVSVTACGIDAVDGIEIAGLVQSYRGGEEVSIALTAAQAHIGYHGAAAGLASLIHAALCLANRILPAVPGWSAPKLPALWRGAPFYVPTDTRPWFTAAGTRRGAAVSALGQAGSGLYLILQEGQPRNAAPDPVGEAMDGLALLPLSAHTMTELLAGVAQIRSRLISGETPPALAAETCASAAMRAEDPLGAAFVAASTEELLRELELAERALPAALERGDEWQTPQGSYFSPAAAGRSGHVALVYPGAFNSYLGMGRDLFRLFPELYEIADRVTDDLGGVLRERQIFPRSLAALDKQALAEREAALLADAIAMLSSGTTLSILTTRLAVDLLGIPAAAAFGYSLGENSMLFSTGVWAQGDDAAERLSQSNMFRERLAGSQQAIREYWQAGSAEEPGALWSNYLLMVDPAKARAEVAKHQRVYLTHINTPRQVVIGGDPKSCQQVIAALGCSSLQAPFDYALHCQAMRSEAEELAYLHDWPVERDPGIALYTAVDMAPLLIERQAIAEKLAAMLTSPLDFPALVRTVYGDGARVFIEVGAGSNCTRWIDETLRSEPHLAVSLNRRGTDDAHTLARALARLHSHRVPVNLSTLYHGLLEKVNRS